ncbi:MAG: hypothetical protein UT31_C0022G0006 [Parcubacteria group bacterium GW2011_GWF2_39_13b]|nr:MAG: hypothetical protein UT31_C0022G0006 [Parcubacteria group bacterium GW2011_GWF2_39_13b]
MLVGYPVRQQAVAMAKGINLPAVFWGRFGEDENICIEIGVYREITIRKAISGEKTFSTREVVRLEKRTKKRKKNNALQFKIQFSDRVWDWLGVDRHISGQEIILIFTDQGDSLAVKMERY